MARESITAGASAGGTRRAATHYGVRNHEVKEGACHSVEQGKEVIEYVFAYDDLPAEGLDQLVQRIPANARIVSATLRVITPFASGTSYNLGLYEEDGSVIDADGIDAAVALTAIDAIGETVACDGALVANTAGIGTAAGSLRVAATGTFTAGKASLKIVYERLLDRAE
ncbi:MAG: hypothetical protein V3S69_05295 [Dehalococcoidales bacterium]